jgi:hypothetical protein
LKQQVNKTSKLDMRHSTNGTLVCQASASGGHVAVTVGITLQQNDDKVDFLVIGNAVLIQKRLR